MRRSLKTGRMSALAVVLDASAVLALLKDEEGADTVVQLLTESTVAESGHTGLLSTVNLVEVRQYASDKALAQLERADSPIAILPFTAEHASRAAALRERTRAFGLSLADRACLTLGLGTGLTVVTAEHIWLKLDVGVTVSHIRPWTLG